jgi:Fe-S cluster assembly protein SufD
VLQIVPKNTVVEHPIQYVVLHDDEQASFYNHVIIVTEESAEVTYVENYLSTTSGEDNQLNIVSEVIAGANSNVTYGSVDYLSFIKPSAQLIEASASAEPRRII